MKKPVKRRRKPDESQAALNVVERVIGGRLADGLVANRKRVGR